MRSPSASAHARELASATRIDYRSNVHANKRVSLALPVVAEDACNIPCFKGDLVRDLRASMPTDEALEEVRVLFAALGDRTRLKILHAFKDGEELCVCDVAHVLGMSVSAASHHLRKLRDLKFLKYRNDGKMAYYSLRDRFVASLVGQALGHTAT